MDRIKDQRPEYSRVAQSMCIFAAAVDVALFIIFWLLNSPILAWVNVISVAMYAVAYYAYGHYLSKLGSALVLIEVVAHTTLGTVIIGWESGFHYYLLIFILAVSVSMRGKLAIGAFAMFWMLYVGLYLLDILHPPIQPIAEKALLGVYLFNLSVVFAMFSYLGVMYTKAIDRASNKLNRLASIDELTQLFNRRQAKALAETELSRADRNQLPLCVALIDIDHFKLINDIYGHDKGDEVLQYVAKIMRCELRQQDIISRWGGEEFMLVFPETDLTHAEHIGERLRSAISSYSWGTDLGHQIQVNVSIGISQHKQEEKFTRLLKRADTALYISKSEGRNRVTAIREIPEHLNQETHA